MLTETLPPSLNQIEFFHYNNGFIATTTNNIEPSTFFYLKCQPLRQSGSEKQNFTMKMVWKQPNFKFIFKIWGKSCCSHFTLESYNASHFEIFDGIILRSAAVKFFPGLHNYYTFLLHVSFLKKKEKKGEVGEAEWGGRVMQQDRLPRILRGDQEASGCAEGRGCKWLSSPAGPRVNWESFLV